MVRRMRSCSTCKRPYISASNLTESCIKCREASKNSRSDTEGKEKNNISSPPGVDSHVRVTLISGIVQEKPKAIVQNENKHLNITNNPIPIDATSFSSSCEGETFSNNFQPRKKIRLDLDLRTEEVPMNDAKKPVESNMTTSTKAACLSDPNYVCIVCGCSLSHLKSGIEGKLNHLKRCAKKNSISLRDLRNFSVGDDPYLIASNIEDSKKEKMGSKPTNDIIDLISSDDDDNHEDQVNENISFVSNMKNNGDTNDKFKDDKDHSTSFHASSTSKQASLTKFFTTPVKSINSVLLEGAKKIAELSKKSSIPPNSRFNNNSSTRKRQWNQRNYSKVGSLSIRCVIGRACEIISITSDNKRGIFFVHKASSFV